MEFDILKMDEDTRKALHIADVSGITFEQVIKLLDSMNADERMDVFAEYCTYCGDKDPSCQCWNDE